jgi:hypothetical protein
VYWIESEAIKEIKRKEALYQKVTNLKYEKQKLLARIAEIDTELKELDHA